MTVNGDTLYEPNETFNVKVTSPVRRDDPGRHRHGHDRERRRAADDLARRHRPRRRRANCRHPSRVHDHVRGANLNGALSVALTWQHRDVRHRLHVATTAPRCPPDGSTLAVPSGVGDGRADGQAGRRPRSRNEETVSDVGSSSAYAINGATIPGRHRDGHDRQRRRPALPGASIANASVTEGNVGTTAIDVRGDAIGGGRRRGHGRVRDRRRNGDRRLGRLRGGVRERSRSRAGQTTKTIAVTVNGDTLYESERDVHRQARQPVGATIAVGTGTGTIVNDDAQPTMRWPGIDLNASVTEGNRAPGSSTFTITRGADGHGHDRVEHRPTARRPLRRATTSRRPATVDVLAGPTDGDDRLTVTRRRPSTRRDETFTVELEQRVGATISVGTRTGTIADDDKPTVNVANLSQLEGNGGSKSPTSFVVTVTLSAPAPYAITVTLSTAATPDAAAGGHGGSQRRQLAQRRRHRLPDGDLHRHVRRRPDVRDGDGSRRRRHDEGVERGLQRQRHERRRRGRRHERHDHDPGRRQPAAGDGAGTAPDAASTAPSASELAAALAAAERWWVGHGRLPGALPRRLGRRRRPARHLARADRRLGHHAGRRRRPAGGGSRTRRRSRRCSS